MNKRDVIDLIKMVDRCYKVDYAGDGDVVNDWYKVLKNYELKDISLSLENYMKFNTTYAPKVYDLIKNVQSIENKKRLENAKTRCMFCGEEIDYDNEKHIDRCRSIEFIKCVARRFKGQEIDVEKYRKMGDKEFDDMHLKAVKLVVAKSNNELEVKMWKKYLESIE